MNRALPPPEPNAIAATDQETETTLDQQAGVVDEICGAGVLMTCLPKTLGGFITAAAYQRYRSNFLAKAAQPGDPLESMLAEQLLWAHHTIGQLHTKAASAQTAEEAGIYHSASARVMAEFRRTTLALREYRSPAVPRQVTVVNQQNVAAGDQQVAYLDGPGESANGAPKNVRDAKLKHKTSRAVGYVAEENAFSNAGTSLASERQCVEVQRAD
ncbi:MAG: hypothetical protein ACYC35_22335 [Pirellulales bacterium]